MRISIDKVTNEVLIGIEGLASSYSSGTHITPHKHQAHQVAHAIAGVLRVSAERATWVVPPGRALWIPAEVEHEIHCTGLVEMKTVYLEGAHSSFPDKLQVIEVSALLREIMVRIAEGFEVNQTEPLTALLLDEIGAMKVEPLSLPTPGDRKLARLTDALLQYPADQGTLTDWAEELGYSPRNLIRHIRMETGLTFRELRRQARVLSAIERLAHGERITTVALDVGFASPSAFTFAFRSVTGMAPRDYLK